MADGWPIPSGSGSCCSSSSSRETHLYDLPDAILTNIFALVSDTRTRNSMSLVSTKWNFLERSTRSSLSLRGNIRDLFLIPTAFRSISHLDLSLLSPWGFSLLDSSSSPSDPFLIAHRLSQAFPCLTSLTVYARTPSTLQLLAPRWPDLRRAKLIRWHQRAATPLGDDFVSLFENCTSLTALDLSHFYCWTEDLPPALQAYPSTAQSLTHLNLLTLSSPEGFKSHDLLAISSSCPNLRELLAACMFDPRYVDFVGDEALLAIAANCPRLSLLHLADTSSLSGARGDPENDGFTQEDARIGRATLEELFEGLPSLEELTLNVCQNVRDAGPALERLKTKCPKLKSLALGQFHGICSGTGKQLDGIALCKGLQALSINNSADLTDFSLIAIARGCPLLAKFEIRGCKRITEMGITKLAGILRLTLVEVCISCCKNLHAAASLRALEPVRDRIQRLHIDCIWEGFDQSEGLGKAVHDFDLNEFDLDMTNDPSQGGGFTSFLTGNQNGDADEDGFTAGDGNGDADDMEKKKKKKCKYSMATEFSYDSSDGNGFWWKTWKRLRYLSLWIAVGELLTPLAMAGLEKCPELEEIRIKVEGDCRSHPKPIEPAFDLIALAYYPKLLKMQLDCGDVIGYALTAPSGHMDLSLWERFYLKGIVNLNLNELDYWPPQDRDVNQRSLSLPAAGLLGECSTLRKLFIHGTAHEHFMKILLNIPNLRDFQLREDYYPAPENDMSTEMRVDSCSRFEDALNRRPIFD